MRRFTAWSCLCLVFAGPFVVQARVAHGLALAIAVAGKSLCESGQEAADEEFDGRDLVAITAAHDARGDLLLAHHLPLNLSILATPTCGTLSDAIGVERRVGPWRWPPPAAALRQSLLQIYRF